DQRRLVGRAPDAAAAPAAAPAADGRHGASAPSRHHPAGPARCGVLGPGQPALGAASGAGGGGAVALNGAARGCGPADIFQLIGIQRKTGVLSLKSGEKTVLVSFLSGGVVSADSSERALEDRLGSVLVKSGKVTERQLHEALKTQKTTLQRLGKILI